MTVKEFISSYEDEEMGFVIVDSKTQKFLIPHIWKTDYMSVIPYTNNYLYKGFHQYDLAKVESWALRNNSIHITIEKPKKISNAIKRILNFLR